ncbi:MAG TPA: hypothetical protein VFQ36_05520 [Ktedonobacteraceae bacterium]|nr:hypothetical protein [Ktedonobacteraceae bacterium]
MPSAILLAHIETWVAELEREVQAFEDAVDEVEQAMDEAEDANAHDDEHDGNRQQQRLYRLENALRKANRIAELVCAANATALDAMDAAQQFMRNEHIAEPVVPVQPTAGQPSSNDAHSAPVPHRVVKARLVMSGLSSAQDETNPLLQSFGQEPLSPGTLILQGRYRIARLLHARPRVNLYLGYRLPAQREPQAEPVAPELVAIRELVLGGLSSHEQELVVHAAFEEFVSPMMFGSPRLPGVGDRISIERERHYLVMQLRPTKGTRQAVAVPLSELLLAHRQWPGWLDMAVAYEWGARLCRIVARLHRMGCIIGDLDPETILVDNAGAANWVPVLLVSWPPARQFWPSGYAHDLPTHLFPIAVMPTDNVFAAPEMLHGRCDERSDVYALGAILYLLFTRYAPVSSALRLASEGKYEQGNSGPLRAPEGMSLVPPHLLNSCISSRLESILTRALALNPGERFPSAFALVEALDSIDPDSDFADPFATRPQQRVRHDSKVTKVLEWVRRELND